MPSHVESQICRTIADVLEIDVSQVSPDQHFVNDLGANSLDVVEFVMRLEDHFKIEVPDDAADRVQTVGDLIQYICQLVIGPCEAETKALVAVASDHAGFALKSAIIRHLTKGERKLLDPGPAKPEPCDYPEYAVKVATAVVTGEAKYGILVCGTGAGMCITANKVPGIRAALVHSAYEARMTREHNDANVICLGSRVVGEGQAIEAVELFLATAFDPGDDGRHRRRVELIDAVEKTFAS